MPATSRKDGGWGVEGHAGRVEAACVTRRGEHKAGKDAKRNVGDHHLFEEGEL